MSSKAISVTLDESILARVDQLALSMEKSADWLMAEVIKSYVEHQDWFVKSVEEGIKAADEGRLINHEDIKRNWELKRANKMD